MHTHTQPSVLLILTLWAAGLGAAAQFAKISAIFPRLQEIYPDAGAWLGFLVSLISFLGILLGLFAGLIAARLGFRRLILAALLLGAVVSAGQSTLPPLWVMLISRVIEGLSHLVIVVVAPTLIAQMSSDRFRPVAMTLWSTFFGVSFALVVWLGVPLVDANGAGSLFVAHGFYMLVIAALLFMQLPEDEGGPVGVNLGFSDVIAEHGRIYRSPFVAAPAIGWLFYTLTFVSLLTVLPDMVAPKHRAFVAGTMPLAGIAVSMTLGVLLLRVLSAVQVVLLGFGLATFITSGFLILPGDPWLCVALLGALGLVQGASFVAIPALNREADAQARANGALAQMGNLGNACGTPILLLMIAGFGPAGLVWFAVICYTAGISAHVILARRRAQS